jgi:hypothetical protein
MFKFNDINLPEHPYISKPIENRWLYGPDLSLSNFDREGYELLPIEQQYYRVNGAGLHLEHVYAKESGQTNGWYAAVQPWAIQIDGKPPFYLDHSFCVVRLGYEGEALEQLKKAAKSNPELSKLVHTRPKYGLDFCLDIIHEGGMSEVVHFEWDFLEYNYFCIYKKQMEDLIAITKWDRIGMGAALLDDGFKSEYSDIIGDKKARLFGISGAFKLYKSIA